MHFEEIKKFLLSKIRVKNFKVHTEENFLQIDYEPEENQDFENIIVNNLDEMWSIASKEMSINPDSKIQLIWTEDLLLIS